MAKLRVISWNLRTLGTHNFTADMVQRITAIILNGQIDIFCIQEIQVGIGIGVKIGDAISATSLAAVQALVDDLNSIDSGGVWQVSISGADKSKGTSMRDAYGFIWKGLPSRSGFRHDEPLDGITLIGGPDILNHYRFPGRRPGMATFNLIAGAETVPVNIVSYHALTPTNILYGNINGKRVPGAGMGVMSLAYLDEIGGCMPKGNGYNWDNIVDVKPLPNIDTIVLGDFNYSMTASCASVVYHNLITNYQVCIGSLTSPVLTTYSSDAMQALRLTSAYDNIFVLKPHKTFVPALTFSRGDVHDFIKEEAEAVGSVIDVTQFATEMAWFMVFNTLYRRQHAKMGLSDHLPVWAEFTLGTSRSVSSSSILSTSPYQNNCLFHAAFGAPGTTGVYFDANAQARRQHIADTLTGWGNAGTLMTQPARIRQAIWQSMLVWFDGLMAVTNVLAQTVGNDLFDPTTDPNFALWFTSYANGITNGRMMYANEIELVGNLFDVTIALSTFTPDRSGYITSTYNPGAAATVNIFHQFLHFNRFNPPGAGNDNDAMGNEGRDD